MIGIFSSFALVDFIAVTEDHCKFYRDLFFISIVIVSMLNFTMINFYFMTFFCMAKISDFFQPVKFKSLKMTEQKNNPDVIAEVASNSHRLVLDL